MVCHFSRRAESLLFVELQHTPVDLGHGRGGGELRPDFKIDLRGDVGLEDDLTGAATFCSVSGGKPMMRDLKYLNFLPCRGLVK